MKIYFRRRSIPELKDLPSDLRRRNYSDAFRMIRSHYQFWVGMIIYLALVLCFMSVFSRLFPHADAFVKSIVSVMPCVIIWNQINIHLMRKYYKHILERRA